MILNLEPILMPPLFLDIIADLHIMLYASNDSIDNISYMLLTGAS